MSVGDNPYADIDTRQDIKTLTVAIVKRETEWMSGPWFVRQPLIVEPETASRPDANEPVVPSDAEPPPSPPPGSVLDDILIKLQHWFNS